MRGRCSWSAWHQRAVLAWLHPPQHHQLVSDLQRLGKRSIEGLRERSLQRRKRHWLDNDGIIDIALPSARDDGLEGGHVAVSAYQSKFAAVLVGTETQIVPVWLIPEMLVAPPGAVPKHATAERLPGMVR